MQWIRKRLLIWGTTYPEFSTKYYETVCTGAIDADTGRLIRIYPITLRHLEKRFRAYFWIVADVMPNSRDNRPESYRINQDSIEVLDEKIGTDDGWLARRGWVLRDGNVFPSVKSLLAAQESDRTSLGLVKPGRVVGVYARKRTAREREEWMHKYEAALAQKDLFVDVDSTAKDLVLPGVEYRMRFLCADNDCPTQHDMSILDWGMYQLSRKQFAMRGAAQAEKDVIDKINWIMDQTKRDAYLFLGNSLPHPRSFMIVGFFYPPVMATKHVAPPPQLSLQLG